MKNNDLKPAEGISQAMLLIMIIYMIAIMLFRWSQS